MQALDMVDNSGFIHLLKTFKPSYDPPLKKTLKTKYLPPQMYDAEHKKIKKDISQSISFALTTDIWTSRANHTYTGVTIHFIDNAFKKKLYLLETREFPETHSAANIAHELKEILSEWDLPECNISAITRDNGKMYLLLSEKLNAQVCHAFPILYSWVWNRC